MWCDEMQTYSTMDRSDDDYTNVNQPHRTFSKIKVPKTNNHNGNHYLLKPCVISDSGNRKGCTVVYYASQLSKSINQPLQLMTITEKSHLLINKNFFNQ